MTSASVSKVRLVKCPKCLKVLQEFEDVPVYQCGGCFTILQAKKRSMNPNGTWSAKVVETAQNSESQTVSEYKGSSCSSSRDNVLPSSAEFSLEQEYEEDQNHNGSVDSIKDQIGGGKLSNGDQTDEIQPAETSDSDSEKNEGENNRFEENGDTLAVAAENSSDLRSLAGDDQEPTVTAREGTLSAGDQGQEAAGQTCSDIVVVCPDEQQNQSNHYGGHPPVESKDDLANKNSSAYDGSASSSPDGREDQIPEGQMHISPSTDEKERSDASEERLRKGKLLMQGYSGYKQRTRASSVLSEEKQNKWDWNMPVELRGHPLNRNWRRSVKAEFSAHLPLYHRGTSFSGAYERGSPSYASLDELHGHHRAHYSLQMPQYGGGSHSGLMHIPAYNEQESFPRMYRDVSYVRHTGGRSRAQASMFSGIPFSGEAVMTRRHHVGHLSSYSGQFKSLYNFYPGSPQRHIEPPPGYYPGWSREIVSDVEDHHRRDSREFQTYMRERQQPVAKRHLRPVAGGAPFVTCYHCSVTLELPVDFLIFKRKNHFLRCSNCNNVLRFSLQDTTHLVPAAATETQTKPSRKIDANRDDNSASGSCRDDVSSKPEKMSSAVKNEKLTVAKGSPLHRLMGYSSVSQVFKAPRRPPSLRISDYYPASK